MAGGTLTVTLRYFAVVRERLGTDAERATLPEGATLSDAVDEACRLHPDRLPAMRAHLRFAVGLEFADGDRPLAEGDEVAFIPPVAGGVGAPPGAAFLVTARPLDAPTVVGLVDGRDGAAGGVCAFTGVVRRQSHGREVVRLEYEAHEAMALAVLRRIGAECESRWPGARIAIHHRVGVLWPGDLAVVIAAAAPHRAEAFAACRHAIERVKEDCPIWKREVGPDGAQWVGMGS